ncbi:Tim44 domain-containing protein [Desulfoplanes formicivorans]|uniref:Import inner membrane translocase subunit Tim44 n=1 Tax=Desulfoplanes formicivorans TaxID=1592317 RepID=A0A194ABF4_9BACT|nr:Tim44-like domain-containing protein [Desulfoplanes formicivorans]GAU07497.1 import inner membrane translocase subunit Tim44 [Desulfoplanes formicivorans]
MRLKHILILLPIMLVVLTVMAMVQTAEAKRFGGGRSFGGRSSYSKSYSRPMPSKSFGQQQNTRAGRVGQAPNRSRWGGMFGGLLGGMLMGGLLGSLFGGGHFMGPNLLDLLLIGGGIFLLMRFLRKRREASVGATSSGGSPYTMDTSSYHTRDGSASETSAWDNLQTGGSTPSGTSSSSVAIPPDFDQEDFMKGAKAVYQRLQNSWDKRDLDDIRTFTSPEVYRFIEEQYKNDPTPSTTEILLLNGELLEVKTIGNQTVATVHFDVIMREDPSSQATEQVREIWHFSKYENKSGDNWVLEGIQQLEN